jgi:hypothetical protein
MDLAPAGQLSLWSLAVLLVVRRRLKRTDGRGRSGTPGADFDAALGAAG